MGKHCEAANSHITTPSFTPSLQPPLLPVPMHNNHNTHPSATGTVSCCCGCSQGPHVPNKHVNKHSWNHMSGITLSGYCSMKPCVEFWGRHAHCFIYILIACTTTYMFPNNNSNTHSVPIAYTPHSHPAQSLTHIQHIHNTFTLMHNCPSC